MTDKNGKEIQRGDIVRVNGGYFKTSNGLFFVADTSENGANIWLHRIGKTGKVLDAVQGWPLRSYCSDARKNATARAHNAEQATIEVVEGVNAWGAGEWFQGMADGARERAKNQRRHFGPDSPDAARSDETAAEYQAVAERLFARSKKPAEKVPETGIKFFWNGIKVNGGKLIPCFYSLDNNSASSPEVSISAKDYGAQLPTEYFVVKNDTDVYTDYICNDRTTLEPSHPLYRFARYVAMKRRARGQAEYIAKLEAEVNSGRREPWAGHYDSLRKDIEKRRAWLVELEMTPDPGQPTAADLAAVEDMKNAAESARLAAEHAASLAEREAILRKRSEGRVYIEGVAAAHPLADGAPSVEITFSENPAFHSWTTSRDSLETICTVHEDGTTETETRIGEPRRRLILSVAAAEIVLKHYDEQRQAEDAGGYDKTDFLITYTDEAGEKSTYSGRYDLGDGDGGLVDHVRAFGKWCSDHAKNDTDASAAGKILFLADLLEEHTAEGRVVSVFMPIDFQEVARRIREKREAQSRAEWDDIMDTVQMLTDEQLEAIVLGIPADDQTDADVARFFLQELARRDRQTALDVFRRWREQKNSGETLTPEEFGTLYGGK